MSNTEVTQVVSKDEFLSFFKKIYMKASGKDIFIKKGLYFYTPQKSFTIYCSKDKKFSQSPSQEFNEELSCNNKGFFAVGFYSIHNKDDNFSQKIFDTLKKYKSSFLSKIDNTTIFYKGNILKFEAFPEKGMYIFVYSGGGSELIDSNSDALTAISKFLSLL